ncbi:hypothetical protein DER46DRAFT_330474 [Fusarium sp. MPI-SDFR-AT-0072]|nr:hypothetical protein DER46DRAFT_330474 [Fusarium sp. MPI-SDFR-AT-0072]
MECRADTLLVIIKASSIAISRNHASTALNILFEPVTLAIGDRPHARDSVVEPRSKTNTALTDPFTSDDTRRCIRIFGVGHTLTCNAFRSTSTTLPASAWGSDSRKSRPLIRSEAREHGRESAAKRGTSKCRAMDGRHIVGDVGNHGACIKISTRWRGVETSSIGIAAGSELRLLILLTIADLGSAELEQACLQIGQRTFDKAFTILEVDKKIVPKLMFGQNFGIAQNDEAILGSSQSHVQTTRVRQKPNALIIVGSNTR